MKKFFSMMLALVAAFTFVACGPEEPNVDKAALATPAVKVDAVTAEGFTLSWNAVENAASYDVEINGDVKSTTTAGYTATGLTPGQYTVRVKAVAAAGSNFADSEYAVVLVTVEEGANVDWFSQELFLDTNPEAYIHPFNAIFFKWTGEDIKSLKFNLYYAADSYNMKDADFIAGKYEMNVAEDAIVSAINTNGSLELYFSELDENIEYEMVTLVTNNAGDTYVARGVIGTEALDEAVYTEWCSRWVSTWDATCTNSFVWAADGEYLTFSLTEDAQSFTVTTELDPQTPGMLLIFGLSKIMPDVPAIANIDPVSGNCAVYAGIVMGDNVDGWTPMWIPFGIVGEELTLLGDELPVYLLSLDGDDITSRLYSIPLQDGSTFDCVHMDIYAVHETGSMSVYLSDEEIPASFYAGYIDMTRGTASAQKAAVRSFDFSNIMPTRLSLR